MADYGRHSSLPEGCSFNMTWSYPLSTQDSVVRRLISNNPGLKFNPRFFIFFFKSIFSDIFLYFFFVHPIIKRGQKELKWIFFLSFHIWIQISYWPWVTLTYLWTTRPTAFTSEGRKDLGSLLFNYSPALKLNFRQAAVNRPLPISRTVLSFPMTTFLELICCIYIEFLKTLPPNRLFSSSGFFKPI